MIYFYMNFVKYYSKLKLTIISHKLKGRDVGPLIDLYTSIYEVIVLAIPLPHLRRITKLEH